MGDTLNIIYPYFCFFFFLKKKKMYVHVVLKIFVDLKNCDLIFIDELKILNTWSDDRVFKFGYLLYAFKNSPVWSNLTQAH